MEHNIILIYIRTNIGYIKCLTNKKIVIFVGESHLLYQKTYVFVILLIFENVHSEYEYDIQYYTS